MGNGESRELVVKTDDGKSYKLRVESESFAEGACKRAYKAKMITPRECDVVIKLDMHKRTMQKDDWEVDVKSAKRAEELAKAFNEKSGTSRPLHFRQPIPMKVIAGPKSQFEEGSYVLVEAYLEGDYKKWNDNYETVNEEDKTSLQAFSHFTHKETNGKLLICDIQGVKDANQYSLTDPAIHSDKRGQYGGTDLGPKGMKAFFKGHKCDEYCHKLGLQDGDATNSSSNESEVAEGHAALLKTENGNDFGNKNIENTMLFHDRHDREEPQPQHSSRSEKTKLNPAPAHQAAPTTSLEASSRKEKAEQLKIEGNKAYKEGNMQLAIKLYTQALQHDPGDHAVYSNRSMAYEKARQYEKAVKDAEMCIQLKPDWVKGYYRKGVALVHLRQYSEAADAYRQGLQYEPRNQDIKKALSSVEEKLLNQRMASGVFGGEHAPPRPPTKQEKQIERTRNVMENLHSESKLNSLLRRGNALNDVPASVRRALANAGSSKEISSEEELCTGSYIIHREKVRLPNGSIRNLSLHVRLEFIRETVTSSGRVTKIIRYYRLIMEWK